MWTFPMNCRSRFSQVILVLGILGISGTGFVHAGGQWRSIGPYGAEVRALAIDPLNPSTLYAGTYDSGLFRTTNAGTSWTGITNPNLLTPSSVCKLAIDPLNPSILYAATQYEGVFRSTDKGDNWTSINNGLSGPPRYVTALAIDPVTPSILYASLFDEAYRSTNSGQSWTPINSGLPGFAIYALAIDRLNPSILYAGTEGAGVYRSTNGGQSWNAANTGLTDPFIYSLVIDPVIPSTLYATTGSAVHRSTNSGQSWTALKQGWSAQIVMAMVIDPLNPSTLYAGTNGDGIFRSTNRGANWTRIQDGLSSSRVYAMAIDPLNPSILYAGTRGPVFRSINRGDSWNAVNNGFAKPRVSSLAVDPLNPITVYAGTYNLGVFVSTNAGASWTALSNGLPTLPVWTLAIDPLNSSILYAGTSGGLFRSNDSGKNWVDINEGFTALYLWALAIDPLNPSTLYAGIYSEVYRSTNSGQSWTPINSGLPSHQINTLAIDPLNPSILYAGTGGRGVYRTTNSGAAWTAINNGLTDLGISALAIDPLTPTTLYAGTTRGLFRSTNGGDSWTTPINNGLTDLGIVALAIDPLNPSILHAGTGDGVYRSTDSGDSWTGMNTGLTAPFVRALAIDPLNPSTLYAGTEGSLAESGVFVYRPEFESSSFYFPQIADGRAGTLQFQSTLILVNTGQDSLVRVEFYRTPDGEPMNLTLGQLGTDFVFQFDLEQGESVSLPTPGTGSPQVGYARVSAGEGVGGVVVFRRTDLATGISLYEAGVPASSELREFCLFVDSLGPRDTGFALVYPPSEETTLAQTPEANITIHLYDKQHGLVAEKTLESLAPGSHLARYVHELFDDPQLKAQAREMQGILQVESDQPLVAVTVRQHDDPAREFPQEVPFLTTFPVVAGKPGGSSSMEDGLSSFFFPQLGDGAAGTLQFQSTLILVNTGSDTSVRVELYGTPHGEPMTLTLGELGADSVFDFELKSGESLSLSTPGTGTMQVGYARVSAGAGVGGVVVFQRTDLTTGVSLYEAGVPASRPGNAFCLFVDSLGVRDTGFALVYPPEEEGSSSPKPEAQVTLRLYNRQYQLIAERNLEPLAAGAHLARFVHEMFEDPAVKAQAREMEGMLVIESDQPIVAVTVRQNDDPMKEFPQEVPVLTTFPVVPGAPE